MRRRLAGYLKDAGRDPAAFGVEVFLNFMPGRMYRLHQPPNPNVELVNEPELWRAKVQEADEVLGATHAAVMTMDYGLPSPASHLEAIKIYAAAVFG
jgi:hypothetical protein